MLLLFINPPQKKFIFLPVKKNSLQNSKSNINLRRVFQLNKNNIKCFTYKFGLRRLYLNNDLTNLHELFNNYKKNSLYKDGKLLKAIALELIKNQKSYRSRRLRNKMPVRGQRTHTNSKTRRKRDIK